MIKIEITGIPDIIAFIELFMGNDEDKMAKLTTDLNQDTDNLVKAEETDKQGES